MPIIVENNPSNAELFTSVTGSSSHVVGSLEELKRTLADQPQPFLGTRGGAHCMPESLERLTQRAAQHFLVFDENDVSHDLSSS